MKGKTLRKINFSLFAVAILLLSGCYGVLWVVPPVAGTGLGVLHDSQTSDIAAIVPGWEVAEVKIGAQIIVILKDGTIVSGEYFGIDSIPNEEYATKYAELQKQMPEGSFLPSIGDTITVLSKLITRDSLKFLGFEYGYINLGLLDSDKSGKLKFENLENITDKHRNKTEGEVIRNLISEGKIPPLFLSRIAMGEYKKRKDAWEEETVSAVGKKFIYINDIDHIQIKSRKYGTFIGCLLGSAADAAIAVGFLLWFTGHL
jgi:hypothetical protein